jgi:hypothetical protein
MCERVDVQQSVIGEQFDRVDVLARSFEPMKVRYQRQALDLNPQDADTPELFERRQCGEMREGDLGRV